MTTKEILNHCKINTRYEIDYQTGYVSTFNLYSLTRGCISKFNQRFLSTALSMLIRLQAAGNNRRINSNLSMRNTIWSHWYQINLLSRKNLTCSTESCLTRHSRSEKNATISMLRSLKFKTDRQLINWSYIKQSTACDILKNNAASIKNIDNTDRTHQKPIYFNYKHVEN